MVDLVNLLTTPVSFIKGEASIYECPIGYRTIDEINLEDGQVYHDLPPWEDKELEFIGKYQNQILEDGLDVFMGGFFNTRSVQDVNKYDCVQRVVAGVEPHPTPSTYTTQQVLEQPLVGLSIGKNNVRARITSLSGTDQGKRATFEFRRPRRSFAGAEITEIGLEVSNGSGSPKLLSRIVKDPGQIALHTFSSVYDTIITWDLIFKV